MNPYSIPVVGPMFWDDPGAEKAKEMRQQASDYVKQRQGEDAQLRQRLLEQRMAMLQPLNGQLSRLYGTSIPMPDVKGYFGGGGAGGPGAPQPIPGNWVPQEKPAWGPGAERTSRPVGAVTPLSPSPGGAAPPPPGQWQPVDPSKYLAPQRPVTRRGRGAF